MKKVIILILAGILFLSLACSKKITGNEKNNAESEQATNLYETIWILKKINTKIIQVEVGKKAVSLSIDKESGNVNGYAGCNRYFGKFEKKKETITFSQMGATKMMCPSEIMNIEDSFLKALNKVDNYLINENELLLRKGENVLLTFVAVH
ncbi:MAG: META domain-containing protein [Bacteroidales bacterium]|jgi:heat shock protein HslJ|nr:META domain-containing protein [Bacteroidales bacterium]